MKKQLLPIGTVIKLKESEKKMLICGYCPVEMKDPIYVYDYSGFPYPEGYTDKDVFYQFDNEQIEGIVALGYQEQETYSFLKYFEENLEEIKQKTKEKIKSKNSVS